MMILKIQVVDVETGEVLHEGFTEEHLADISCVLTDSLACYDTLEELKEANEGEDE